MTRRLAWLALGVTMFAALATANSGGYRFGVSDQAYYLPAVERALDPTLFPRDAAVLGAESRLTIVDGLVASLARTLHVGLPALFAGLYVVTLVILALGAIAIARALRFSTAATTTFLALLTLRHRIARTGANSLEGYMHPRQLAFAIGIAAVACFLRRRHAWMIVALALAAALHPTTGLWFFVWLVPAWWIARPSWRRPIVAGVVVAAVAGVWLITRGPLASHMVVMDAAWLDVFQEKDYLFPSGWPLWAWVVNLAYLPIVWLAYRGRVRQGVAAADEGALVAGLGALVAVFLISVPIAATHLALGVQLQVSRVFWWLDFAAMAALAWWLTSLPLANARVRSRVAWTVAALTVVFSAGRSYYVVRVLENRRPLVEINLPASPWTDALLWMRAQPGRSHVLADPGHAWKFGTSVRAGAARDVLFEQVKDTALAIYDRDVATRVADRWTALLAFDAFTTPDVRTLAARFHLDVFVAENTRAFDLPVLYRNTAFTVYDLR